ncbi:porin [Leucothrix pacifica]|uniref:Porin n=1 Tax=Leucothrix pacifica TaxID=1247513 RepID=A0A317C2M4_9GAMM|nr:porin [Leucothrix pacifica]
MLATAIAGLTASSVATAANVYEKDDLTLSVEGDYQVQIYQAIGDDADHDVDYDDLELKFGAKYNLGNGMTAFGQLDLDWNGQGDGLSEDGDEIIDEAYVGLSKGAFTTSLGRQYWGSDNFGVEKAYEMNGGTAFGTTGGNDTLKLGYEGARFGATLSHEFQDSGDEEATDLMLTTKFGPAEVGIAYQTLQAQAGAERLETSGIMASFDVGPTNVGFDYSTNDDADYTNAAVSFPIRGKTTGAVGATLIDEDGQDDVTQWYLNATHKLHSNVNLFAEIGDNDVDNTDLGYLAGMQVKF